MCLVCLHRCLCIRCTCGIHRGQKGASDPLELELEMFVSHHTVQGIQPGSPERAASALNH